MLREVCVVSDNCGMGRKHFPRGMYGSEEELCQQFTEYVRKAGYIVHSELTRWDLVLVDKSSQLQIGVQAKLVPNVTVLAQALTYEKAAGPDVHAVLVPVASSEFCSVAHSLRLLVFEGRLIRDETLSWFPELIRKSPKWAHPSKEWVPEVEVDVAAGVPAPRTVTPWKLAAVTLCLRARERGFVTAADLRDLKLRRHWWFAPMSGPVLKMRSRGEYVLRDASDLRNPDLRWPEITRALQRKERGTPRPRKRVASK